MPRRARVIKREILPDAKYQNVTIVRLVNKVMSRGKKSLAERIVYDALRIIEQQESKEPVSILEQALRNATPLLEVKPRRVGGATYQVPVEVRPDRGLSLAIRWLLKSTRANSLVLFINGLDSSKTSPNKKYQLLYAKSNLKRSVFVSGDWSRGVDWSVCVSSN